MTSKEYLKKKYLSWKCYYRMINHFLIY